MSKKYLVVILIILLILVISILYFIISNNYKENIVIEHLNNKYGDGNWNIVSKENYAFYTGAGLSNWSEPDGLRYIVTSSFKENETFHIYLNESNMITEDCFLPTYYSIKYGLSYGFNTTINEQDRFDELIDRMVYVSDYHYPYKDWKILSSGWYL